MADLTGTQAPSFELPDQDGKVHKLSDYSGKYFVLYFYPRDLTPGCTKEAECFRDKSSEFSQLGVPVLGVSRDDEKTHRKFIEKYNLNFPLLADTEKKVCEAYGLLVEKNMYGKKVMGVQRDTFLIGPDGKVVKHYIKVTPETHTDEVLEDLKELLS